MALTATQVVNPAQGPDFVIYTIADDGAANLASVSIDPGTVWTPEYALFQITTTAVQATRRAWAGVINTTTGAVVVSTAGVDTGAGAGTVGTVRVTIGRWPRPQNRS
jgi:hypothetical protein